MRPRFDYEHRPDGRYFAPIPAWRDGHAGSLDDRREIVRIRHALGFRVEDWGEGNWTAKDLR